MTPCDAIPVYAMMNGDFKGGLDNVMLRNKDPVDSRYHQRCMNNRHRPGTRASVCEKPIWERGRFGCSDSPVRDADWSDECSVGVRPVGDVRIEYIGDAFSQGQSTDAAPLTELFDFYTLLHIYSDCATWISGRPVWRHVQGRVVYTVGCPRSGVDIIRFVSLGSFPDKVGLSVGERMLL